MSPQSNPKTEDKPWFWNKTASLNIDYVFPP